MPKTGSLEALSGVGSPGAISLEGFISVRAALDGERRVVHAIYIERNVDRPEAAALRALARAKGIRVLAVSAARMSALTESRTHGGVIALAGPREYLDVAVLAEQTRGGVVVMLDGIEDPHNFGHTVRSLYAAGVDGIVIRRRDWRPVEHIVVRASAGTSELLPMAMAESPMAAMETFRRAGARIVCTARAPDACSLYDADLGGALLLVIGGEKRGVSRSVLAQADIVVRIPYGRAFRHALGLTAAASICAFHIMRRRRIELDT